ncbi:hypothetical protein J6590_014639 [Homalodisca vitripennis]|nr:hypothetical protein J6590_014639 [Homalodisca vitripennis]
MRPTTLWFQQFCKPPKKTDQVLLEKFTIFALITKDGVPLSCYCRTFKEQVLSSFLVLVTHSTERTLPKDTDSEDASSGQRNTPEGHRGPEQPAQQGKENKENIQPPLQANRSHSVSSMSFIWTKRVNRPLNPSEGYYITHQTPL